MVAPEEVAEATGGLAYPHTAHCLASGEVMISAMGTTDGKVSCRSRGLQQ